jgi:hypothetical protein
MRMDNTTKFILVLALVALGLSIAAYGKDCKSTKAAEAMKASSGWGLRSDAGARAATKNLGVGMMDGTKDKMRRMETQASLLPASLYAGLNYGAGTAERIPASQPMVDALDGLFDNTKVNATMGNDAVFFLRAYPDQATMDHFNAMTLSAVKPEVRHQVVVVVQSAPGKIQGKFAVYAFLDKGIKWGEDMVDYCQTPEHCVKSDIYVNAARNM